MPFWVLEVNESIQENKFRQTLSFKAMIQEKDKEYNLPQKENNITKKRCLRNEAY